MLEKVGFELDFEPAGVALGNIDAEDNGGGAGGTDADADAKSKATLDLAIAGPALHALTGLAGLCISAGRLRKENAAPFNKGLEKRAGR